MPQSEPGDTVLSRIHAILGGAGVDYRHLTHEPTPTSEDSARVRGEPLEIGGKALVLKADGRFLLVVMSAACCLDSKRLKKHLKAKSMRFATSEELLELTGLVPGSVPPFGRPLLELELLADVSVMAHPRIAFNAGALTESIIMRTSDWETVAKPQELIDVCLDPPGAPRPG